jgi:hypothetical protein
MSASASDGNLTLEAALQQAVVAAGESDVYLCPFAACEKTFRRKGTLLTHLRVHTGKSTLSAL